MRAVFETWADLGLVEREKMQGRAYYREIEFLLEYTYIDMHLCLF